MFAYCESLTSLDLSSFNIAKVTSMNNIFNSCINLKYIHLDNFEKNRLSSSVNVFNDVPENIIVCIKEINSQSKILSNLKNVKICYSIDCIDDLASKQKKLNDNNYIDNKCNEICDKSSKYKYEYNGKCYADCEKGFLYDENNNQMNKCKCHLDKCLLYSPESLKKGGLCTKCNNDYYEKINDPLNTGIFINCYKNPEGYYLNNNLYKECYHSCKTCTLKEMQKIIIV